MWVDWLEAVCGCCLAALILVVAVLLFVLTGDG